MTNAVRFPYTSSGPDWRLTPVLPVTLTHLSRQITVNGLVDSGANANVLPYTIGQRLGLQWEQQQVAMDLTGAYGRMEGRIVVLKAEVAQFSPVDLVFVWAASDHVKTLLGQVNFFLRFDVCFFRTEEEFSIKPKETQIS